MEHRAQHELSSPYSWLVRKAKHKQTTRKGDNHPPYQALIAMILEREGSMAVFTRITTVVAAFNQLFGRCNRN